MTNFNSRFREFIKTNNLLISDRIVIAFSGGKDSVTLFHLLNSLKSELHFQLSGAYMNHNLRNDSADEEKWVKNFFAANATPLHIRSLQIGKMSEEEGINLENIASRERYNFFREIHLKEGATVVTAHTQSDLTETFLIKLFRGSGTQGLTAIHLKKDNYIERPLLGFTTEDVRQFIKENRFSFYQDSSNLTSDFLRNRIRNSIIPQLKEINPLLDEAMSRTTDILKEEYRYFTDRADRFLKQHLKIKKILPASPLLEEPVAMQRHILRQYIRLIKGDLLNIGYEHIEAIIDSIGTNNSLAIPGTELSTDKQFLYPSTIDIPDYSFELNREDTLLIAHAGFKITTAITDIPVKDEKNRVVTVPVSSLSLPLTVRSPLKTDKYRKAKTSFRQKIFEMIRAAGISVPLRNLCPVILTEDTPVWAYRCPVSADFYINPSDSPPYLKISIEEL